MADLAQQFRRQQVALGQQMLGTLIALWPALDPQRLDATFPQWALAVGQLIIARRAVSASLGEQFLQAARFASGVPGPPTIVPASPVEPAQLATSLRITSVVAVKQSMLAGQPIHQAMQNAFVQSTGAATRQALAGGRDTVQQSIQADPRVQHMRRIARPDACAFCAMLSSRGAVYKTAGSAGAITAYHDHCNCVVEPVYGYSETLDAEARKNRDLWEASTAGVRGSKEAQRAFRGAYDQQHRPDTGRPTTPDTGEK